MTDSAKDKPIRVGVVGVGRGQSFAANAEGAGLKLVALCDTWEERLLAVGRRYDVATYAEYDRFLEHDMDAVILANYFHQHAPFAIKALAAGKHVMSETSANKTLAEGVALCRAAEQSGKIYMLAENYPYTAFNQELRRLYQADEIGRVLYAEGEYNHPMSPDDRLRISPGLTHWRSWLPPTYYCTHALAPLMYITETMPISVIGLGISAPEQDERTVRVSDPGAVILCRMDNGAVFRIFGLTIPGHSIWYRVHGLRGSIESERGPGYWGTGRVRIVHEEWDRRPGEPVERVYVPDWPAHADPSASLRAGLALKSGHGGGDFWTDYHFARAIRSGEPPFLDVYRGVAMSTVGILAWKSALSGGQPFAMPDFRDETSRQAHADDNWSPFPEDAGPALWQPVADQPPPSLRGWVKPSEAAVAHAHEVWRQIGYIEKP
jgi:predicted dehydrogenase